MTYKKLPTMSAVLTPFPYHIDRCEALMKAKEMMHEYQVRHLVVMDAGELSGILYERDLNNHSHYSDGQLNDDLLVGDLCSDGIIAADIDDPLDKVMKAMVERRLDNVLVLREGELIGIFTSTDACIHFSRFLTQYFSPEEVEKSIRV